MSKAYSTHHFVHAITHNYNATIIATWLLLLFLHRIFHERSEGANVATGMPARYRAPRFHRHQRNLQRSERPKSLHQLPVNHRTENSRRRLLRRGNQRAAHRAMFIGKPSAIVRKRSNTARVSRASKLRFYLRQLGHRHSE